MTTASPLNALRAHEAGAPHCPGRLQLVVDFGNAPLVTPKPRGRRRAAAPVTAEPAAETPVRPQAPSAPNA